jgi:hypothetical protein
MALLQLTVTKIIRRPRAQVARQFGDLSHHVANNVHPDVRLVIHSDDGRTMRLSQHVRLLGMDQVDEVVQQRRDDDTLDSEVVDGMNKGLRLRQSFRAEGPDATEVRLEVHWPLTGIKAVLKPLFGLAVRQTLVKALEEDRRDLEERGYPRAS